MLLTQTLLYLPAQLLGPLLQFTSVLVWTHWLLPEDFGALALVIAYQELIHLLCLAGWSQYATRYTPTMLDDRARRRFQQTENAVLAVSVCLQVCVGAAVIWATIDSASLGLIAATAAFNVSRSLLNHLTDRARSAQKILTYSLLQVVGPSLGFGLSLLAMTLAGTDIVAAITGLALGQSLIAIVFWGSLPIASTRVLRPDPEMCRAALLYGLPLLATGVVGWFGTNAIRLVVEYEGGTEAVGLLSVAWSLGNRLISVSAVLVTAASFPLAVRSIASGDGRAASLDYITRGGALLFAVLVPCAAATIVLTDSLTDLVVGSEFRSATKAILPIAVAAGAIRFLHIHFSDQVFLIMERPGLLLAVAVIEMVATAAFSWIGLIQGGLVGACIGACAGFALATVLSMAMAVIRYDLKFRLEAGVKVLLATALMVAAMRAVPGSGGFAGLVLTGLAGGAAYVMAMALLSWRDLKTMLEGRIGAAQPEA